MKKVKWKWDCGVYAPFCPYCDEPVYEKDHCVFCEKGFEWVDKSKDRIVTVGEYTVIQTSNKHIQIYKGERMVLHAACTKEKTEDELKEMVAHYEDICNKLPDEIFKE